MALKHRTHTPPGEMNLFFWSPVCADTPKTYSSRASENNGEKQILSIYCVSCVRQHTGQMCGKKAHESSNSRETERASDRPREMQKKAIRHSVISDLPSTRNKVESFSSRICRAIHRFSLLLAYNFFCTRCARARSVSQSFGWPMSFGNQPSFRGALRRIQTEHKLVVLQPTKNLYL